MLITNDAGGSLPLWLLTDAELPHWLAAQPADVAGWVRANAFQAERHRVLALPGKDGAVTGAVVGMGALASLGDLKLWHTAGLADRLPAAKYHLASRPPTAAATHAALGWLVGAYR